jgi:threonylcarbamoyladenosine tRNA methylthiotransferase MtaB
MPWFQMTTFFIQQFGCRATQADGAAIERQLLDRGCTTASEAALADIVVLNTCTVTASADSQARDAIRKLHAANPAARFIVTGCYAQRAPEEIAALPGVSWVVGNSHKPQIPDLVDSFSSAATDESTTDFLPIAALRSHSAVPFRSFVGTQHAAPLLGNILTGNIFARTEFLTAPVLGGEGNHTRPTLKIQDGCDSRCSYCVIPFVRGKSPASRPRPFFKKSGASAIPASAKSSSAASTSAPTAAIFPFASNSNPSFAAFSVKPPSSVSVSALSNR